MPGKKDKTIGELLSELSHEVRTLFRQEMALFRAEITGKMGRLAKDGVAIGAGGILIYSGFLVLLAAMVLGLAAFMPAWTAALLVAAACLVPGGALIWQGRKDLTHLHLAPEQTASSLKEAAKWTKTLRLPAGSPQRIGFSRRSGTRKAI